MASEKAKVGTYDQGFQQCNTDSQLQVSVDNLVHHLKELRARKLYADEYLQGYERCLDLIVAAKQTYADDHHGQ